MGPDNLSLAAGDRHTVVCGVLCILISIDPYLCLGIVENRYDC
jgi:hypothetical protein